MIDDSARKALVDGASNALPSTLEGRVTYLLRRVTEAAGRMANAHIEVLGLDTRRYTVLVVVAGGFRRAELTEATLAVLGELAALGVSA